MMIETKLGCCLNGLFLIARGRFSVFFLVGGRGGFPFQEKKKKKKKKNIFFIKIYFFFLKKKKIFFKKKKKKKT